MARNADRVVLTVRHLQVHYPVYGGFFSRRVGLVKAVDDISFDLFAGETLGVVGESGCGKTTTGRAILGLAPATGGSVRFEGEELLGRTDDEFRPLRKGIQMVFQDPYGSLDPRQSVQQLLEEPLLVHGYTDAARRQAQLETWIGRVGLERHHLKRFPHEFSGGQRQRIAIARSLILEPKVVIADEPVSALDVSIQAQIVNTLQDLADEMGLSMIFIAHDITVVHHIAKRILVMYLGQVVEAAEADELYRQPRHPYTLALVSAIPRPSPHRVRERIILPGEPPSPLAPPPGCPLHPRCPAAQECCRQVRPPLEALAPGSKHLVACHFRHEAIDEVQRWYNERKTN